MKNKTALAIIFSVTVILTTLIVCIFVWLMHKPPEQPTIEVPSKDAPYILEENGVKAICTWHEYKGWSTTKEWECVPA